MSAVHVDVLVDVLVFVLFVDTDAASAVGSSQRQVSSWVHTSRSQVPPDDMRPIMRTQASEVPQRCAVRPPYAKFSHPPEREAFGEVGAMPPQWENEVPASSGSAQFAKRDALRVEAVQ